MSCFGATLTAFDELKLLSGGTAASVVVSNEGNFFIAAGAVASATMVEQGGGLFVTGFAGATIVDGGTEYIVGGIELAGIVNAGGVQVVDGGLATDCVLNNGGAQRLAGGTAQATVVDSGAVQYVSAGSVASDTIIASGGVQEVFAGGIAVGTVVDPGAILVVLPGGTVSSAQIEAGGDLISTGVVVNLLPAAVNLFSAAAGGLAIGAAETVYVLSGGAVSSEVISSGGAQYVDAGGQASGTLLLAGGQEIVSGGIAAFTVVSGQDEPQHSFQDVTANGIATGTVVEAGGAQNVSGGAAYGTVLNGGALFVTDGAVSGTVINGGGYMYAGAGAAVFDTAVNGGSENVSGGVAYGAKLAVGGNIAAGFGGVLSNVALDGGTAFLGPDGVAMNMVISSGGALTLAGGTATGTVISSGGAEIVAGNAAFTAAVSEDFSTTILAGGAELVGAQGLVTNVTLAGGVLGFDSGGVASGGIVFDGFGEVFIDQPELPDAVYSGFAPGDAIDLATVTSGPGDYVLADGTAVVVAAGGIVDDFTFAATAPGHFALSAGAAGEVVLIGTPPCFVAGTLILTVCGEVAVERLAPGDRVILTGGDEAPVRWIGRRFLDLGRHQNPALVQPVRIAANSFDEGVPLRDLLVSPDHALFLMGVLVPAKALVNGRNIRRETCATVTYYHVELPRHAVMFAQGCAVESYLDTGNRGGFENGGPALALHPDFAQRGRLAQSCAPFVEHGPVVDALRVRLWQQGGVAAASENVSGRAQLA